MPDRTLVSDLPHEWNEVATQLAYSSVTQQFDMTGFVEAYAALTNTEPVQQADPMGFFASTTVPITSFLARNFCVCDQWHAPLPSSTQPNRTTEHMVERAILHCDEDDGRDFFAE
jgi:phospholipase C